MAKYLLPLLVKYYVDMSCEYFQFSPKDTHDINNIGQHVVNFKILIQYSIARTVLKTFIKCDTVRIIKTSDT